MNFVCPVIGYDRLGLTADWLERFGRVRGEYKQSVLTCVSSFWLLYRSLIDFIPLSFFVLCCCQGQKYCPAQTEQTALMFLLLSGSIRLFSCHQAPAFCLVFTPLCAGEKQISLRYINTQTHTQIHLSHATSPADLEVLDGEVCTLVILCVSDFILNHRPMTELPNN